MKIYDQIDSLQLALSSYRKQKKIGFVPTMGALHMGHLSLVRRALKENSCVVVSIFVNPTQFDNKTDLEKYPRTLAQDVSLLRTLKGTILIFSPEVSQLYPNKITSTQYHFGSIASQMEGKYRKGHFNGVGTIVRLLLKAVQPHTAYFGEKDFQQLQIIKKLVALEKLPVKISGCAIVREKSGLALSSRNSRLSQKQREEATLIFHTLTEVRKKFKTHSIAQLNQLVAERFLNSSLKLEYFEIANEITLRTAERKRKNNKYRAFIAAFAGSVRLIDNMPLN
ncbi:MAG: pantoate--beta-alanine ligase [Altibacter sp.]|uniref:pantoate--beta-alanine ligase n=1 Tax=Altibacter sp. TaxID=2024823 RepID=UPI001D4E3CF5|nr:pantoate--beta-alanine ligase [Altibacter sp.]MBZ0327622.1 pantoate--beta-alanine ligase [Altibacter sp.]